jgi:hypothetical protein
MMPPNEQREMDLTRFGGHRVSGAPLDFGGVEKYGLVPDRAS